MQGKIQEFRREEPPLSIYTTRGSQEGCRYVRDVNPFDDGEKWIYMVEVKVSE